MLYINLPINRLLTYLVYASLITTSTYHNVLGHKYLSSQMLNIFL